MRSSCGLRGGEYIHLVHLTTRLVCLMHIYTHYTSKKEIAKMLWSDTRFDQEADAHEEEMHLRLAWIRWLTFNSGKFLRKTLPNCEKIKKVLCLSWILHSCGCPWHEVLRCPLGPVTLPYQAHRHQSSSMRPPPAHTPICLRAERRRDA